MADAQHRTPRLLAGAEFRLVLVSAPDAECAARLAGELLAQRLAA